MGSYISIVNDTPDPMACSVGTDMAAVEVFGVVTSVIATLGAIISSVGAAAPLLSLAGAHGMFAITGLSTSAVLAIVETAAVAGPVVGQAVTAAGFLKTVVSLSVDAAAQDGYVSIPPGEKHQFGKYSLSLWQQGHCKRYRKDDSKMQVIYDEIYMRPIFSGATDGSNNDHSVQFWLDKWGAGNEALIDVKPPVDRESWGDVNAPLESPVVAPSPVAPSPVAPSPTAPSPVAAPIAVPTSPVAAPIAAPTSPVAAPAASPVSPVAAPASPVAAPVWSPVAARSFSGAKTASTIATTRSGNTPSSSQTCDLCGNGQRIALRADVMVDIPDFGSVSCAVIDAANRAGMIGVDDCPLIGGFLTPCGCPDKKEATKCDFFCGSVPKNEDVIVHIPNGVELTCREIDAINRAGRISEGVCPTIASVLDPCGCAGSSAHAPSNAPASSVRGATDRHASTGGFWN